MTVGTGGFHWAVAGYLGTGVLSALFPWVNAEILVVSIGAVAGSRRAMVLLMLAATVGHMIGKSGLYWTSRGGCGVLPRRMNEAVSRWSERLRKHPRRAVMLVFAASTLGIPPFYVMTVVSGALRMPFALYTVAGTTGRLIRFGAILVLADALVGSVR